MCYLKSDPTKGVSADFDGLFEISFETAPDVLEASALGYEVQSIEYTGQTELTIKTLLFCS